MCIAFYIDIYIYIFEERCRKITVEDRIRNLCMIHLQLHKSTVFVMLMDVKMPTIVDI